MAEKLAKVLIGQDGLVAAFDSRGEQVPEQQVRSYFRVLRDMENEGVLAGDTEIDVLGHPVMNWAAFREHYADWW